MKEILESIRLTLIRWNVAPLFFAAAMCKALFFTLDLIKDMSVCNAQSTAMDAAYVGGLFTFAGVMAGLIYKVYDSMQKNRGGE